VQLVDPRHGVAEGGEDQVLDHLDLGAVEHLGGDGHRPELEPSGHLDAHGPAARLALDHRRGRALLGGGHLLLQVHGHAQQPPEVGQGGLTRVGAGEVEVVGHGRHRRARR
jgi:hypothetical protein